MDKNHRFFKKHAHTLRYSFVHGSYWMAFGASYNFVTVYLLAKSFTSYEIGIIMALTNVFSAILQPLAASFSEDNKKPTLSSMTLTLIFASATLSGLLFFAKNTFWPTAFLYFMLLTVMLTIHPLLNSLGMKPISQGVPINFGFSRGMGSLSYAAMSYILGALVDAQGTSVLPFSFLTLFLLTNLSTLWFVRKLPPPPKEEPDDPHFPKTTLSTWGFMSTYKRFTLYLLGLIFLFICFNLINIYMIKIIENVGGSEKHMGSAFAIAAIVELPFMLGFSSLLKRFKVTTLLKISGLVFTLKAVITYFSVSIPMIYFAQSLQMFSYALFIPGSIYYVSSVIHPRHMVRGQAFTTSATTFGAVFGSLIGGLLLSFTSLEVMLITGVILSTVGTLLLFLAVEDPNQPLNLS